MAETCAIGDPRFSTLWRQGNHRPVPTLNRSWSSGLAPAMRYLDSEETANCESVQPAKSLTLGENLIAAAAI
jgi:hypothetical protein